ncbi:hypothetical protein BIFGAL_03973 [Bifidobacterium gallicum DSM 20093 = LMG 11596]|uniref:Uncharacterized protein n=2 Tax=Bifidobacterium gallicum TaxID=78342 RepID=D1NVT0_9BIFI|nr:hypothetical protein BIFGAL_03973 [Bifidobacterium gallicum DSM 20093 = LMG 11596]
MDYSPSLVISVFRKRRRSCSPAPSAIIESDNKVCLQQKL